MRPWRAMRRPREARHERLAITGSRHPPAQGLVAMKRKSENMARSSRGLKRICPECATEYADQEGRLTACPSCATKPETEAGVVQPLQSVWGAPFRK